MVSTTQSDTSLAAVIAQVAGIESNKASISQVRAGYPHIATCTLHAVNVNNASHTETRQRQGAGSDLFSSLRHNIPRRIVTPAASHAHTGCCYTVPLLGASCLGCT